MSSVLKHSRGIYLSDHIDLTPAIVIKDPTGCLVTKSYVEENISLVESESDWEVIPGITFKSRRRINLKINSQHQGNPVFVVGNGTFKS